MNNYMNTSMVGTKVPTPKVEDNTNNLLDGLFVQLGRISEAINVIEDITTMPKPAEACCSEPTNRTDTVNEALNRAISVASLQATRLQDLNRQIKESIGDIKLLA